MLIGYWEDVGDERDVKRIAEENRKKVERGRKGRRAGERKGGRKGGNHVVSVYTVFVCTLWTV